jgi:hypothetical protein
LRLVQPAAHGTAQGVRVAGALRRGLWHRRQMSEVARVAFQRLVDALNHARDPARVRAAMTDDIHIDRHSPGARGVAPVAESFTGIAEVERWFARTPPVVRFGLAGEPRLEDDRWLVEYALDAGEFHNGGFWLARLAGDGRIASLSHHPFPLRDAPPGAPHSHGGAPHTHG